MAYLPIYPLPLLASPRSASRLESTSRPGAIQVSATVFEELRECSAGVCGVVGPQPPPTDSMHEEFYSLDNLAGVRLAVAPSSSSFNSSEDSLDACAPAVADGNCGARGSRAIGANAGYHVGGSDSGGRAMSEPLGLEGLEGLVMVGGPEQEHQDIEPCSVIVTNVATGMASGMACLTKHNSALPLQRLGAVAAQTRSDEEDGAAQMCAAPRCGSGTVQHPVTPCCGDGGGGARASHQSAAAVAAVASESSGGGPCPPANRDPRTAALAACCAPQSQPPAASPRAAPRATASQVLLASHAPHMAAQPRLGMLSAPLEVPRYPQEHILTVPGGLERWEYQGLIKLRGRAALEGYMLQVM